MQKKYALVAGVIVLLLFGLFWLGSGKGSSQKNTENTLTPASSFSHSHGIAIDIANASKVYIATHEGLYLLSEDKDLFQVGSVRDDLMGFSQHPSEIQTFFSSGHSARGGNIGFQKTTDGGLTWERVSDGLGGRVDFHAMTVSQVNPEIAYGFFAGRLQRSENGGRSWEYTKGSVAPVSLSSDPKNEGIVYAATQDGVLVSKDKGDTWESVSAQLEGGAVSVFVLDPLSTYALTFSEKLGGMGKSTDAGATWQKTQETFGGDIVLYIAFSKTEPTIAYALTERNSVYKSTDRGDSWSKVR